MALDTLASGEPAIFLSASIPMPGRDKIYLESADVIAIRECIKALVAVTIPKFTLIWGGHPSITPLIRLLLSLDKLSYIKREARLASRRQRREFCDAERA